MSAFLHHQVQQSTEGYILFYFTILHTLHIAPSWVSIQLSYPGSVPQEHWQCLQNKRWHSLFLPLCLVPLGPVSDPWHSIMLNYVKRVTQSTAWDTSYMYYSWFVAWRLQLQCLHSSKIGIAEHEQWASLYICSCWLWSLQPFLYNNVCHTVRGGSRILIRDKVRGGSGWFSSSLDFRSSRLGIGYFYTGFILLYWWHSSDMEC